ncbi:MAG: peptidylprolyl isomerase [Gemmatimonadales bacterium]
MRRLGLVLVVLTLAGCNALRDAFSAHANEVAKADGEVLTVERLIGIASRVPNMPAEQAALARIAEVWVDYVLVVLAVVEGHPLDDSATVAQAMWPIVSQMKWEKFHDRLLARVSALTPAQVDSAFQAGETRLFQHILLQVPSSAAADVEGRKRAQIERLLPQVAGRSGAAFARVATGNSEDGSKTQGGYLGVSGRGDYVPAFEAAAWDLAPGAVSGIVKSPFGFHIIRRPPLAEVRDSFRVGLQNRLVQRFDSVYLDSLAIRKRIRVVKRAPALVRHAVTDLNDARPDGRTLATFRGGRFRVRDLVRWLEALDPRFTQSIPTASDDQIREFLKGRALLTILLLQADSAGTPLTPEEWARLRADHDSQLVRLRTALGLGPGSGVDTTASLADRRRLAAERVTDYLQRVVEQRAQFVPMSPFLSDVVRSRRAWSLNRSGITVALEQIRAEKARADSLRGERPPGGGGGPAMEPAPGPAPAPPPPTAADTGRRR